MKTERLLVLAAAYLRHCECGMEPEKFFVTHHLRGKLRRLVEERVKRMSAERRVASAECRVNDNGETATTRRPSWNSYV